MAPRRFRWVFGPLQAFFRLEAASSFLLLGSAVVALIWANTPLDSAHHAIFDSAASIGPFRVSFAGVIDDGLMALFFFLVGMEIKRELAVGELRTFARALLPLIAAAGGMAVPAAIFYFLNHGRGSVHGWGIPMATDIAFSLGVLEALRKRVPSSLFAFLTALAIFDDLGGIIVIAVFYGQGIQWVYLLASAAVAAALIVCNRAWLLQPWPYLGLGLILWWTFGQAGIHPTMAGVVAGLCIPAREHPEHIGPAPVERWERVLHPYVAYGVIPLFALANAGVNLTGLSIEALTSPVALGVGLGLLLGKPLGISAVTFSAVLTGTAPMPTRARKNQLFGVAVIAGVGFTVALFIAELAFPKEPLLLEEAKVGIIIGSAIAALVGWIWLRLSPATADAAEATD